MGNGGVLQAPYEGMIFDTVKDARKYYRMYGRQKGFLIEIKTSSQSGFDEVVYVQFACSGGNIVLKEKDCFSISGCSISGCDACLEISHDKCMKKWIVFAFDDDHNHDMLLPAKSTNTLPKETVELEKPSNRENLQTGNQSCFVDCERRNHLTNEEHQMSRGEAQFMLDHFRKKHVENPQFFYAIQCDENRRLANFFWVDSRSCMAYQYFGDMITFDSTYRITKYGVSFASFTGVNHHLQPIQFGCAVLQDGTEATYLWLFEAWLEAMGGRHPISFITNLDMAMKRSFDKVFPNTGHCFCLSDVKKKLAEKLSQVYFKRSKFKGEMKKCMWSTSKVDFEERWKTLILEYGFEANAWLQELYDNRASWVPVYNSSTCFAGMNNAECSHSNNAFFDGFATSKMNLKEFVFEYEQALKKIAKMESDADFECADNYPIVHDYDFLLKHAAKLYTGKVFEKFKGEWMKVSQYKVEEGECSNGYNTYLVKTKVGDPEEAVVKLNLRTYEGVCECQGFELTGLLCRHILKLFVRLDIDEIPAHFILDRWRKKASKVPVMDAKLLVNGGEEKSEAQRFDHMGKEATKFACYAAQSDEAYRMYMDSLNELSKRLDKLQTRAMQTN